MDEPPSPLAPTAHLSAAAISTFFVHAHRGIVCNDTDRSPARSPIMASRQLGHVIPGIAFAALGASAMTYLCK